MYVVLHTYLTCTKYIFGDDGLDFCATRMSTASTIALTRTTATETAAASEATHESF